MLLEGWSANINFGGVSTDWADHTWVYSPGNNQYFDCWGDHQGPNPRKIVSGDGSYRWANCYRCSIWPIRDTAGIGVYAIDGVCHQATNCFLYTANVTLNFNVRGYWFSLFSYGTFGRSYLRWLAAPYGWCTWTTPRSIDGGEGDEPRDEDEGAMARGDLEEDPAIAVVRRVYGEAARSRGAKHPHDLLGDEVAGITQHHVPEVDFDKLRDIQGDYLRKKDDLIARGHKEEQLANRLDDLARQTQKRIAQKIGPELYERLMGMPAGEQVGLAEPGLVGMAGVPVPPPEALVEPIEEDGGGEENPPIEDDTNGS